MFLHGCVCVCTVSENKVLTHPASVDSISTSAAQEDHVSMGGFSARKAIRSEIGYLVNSNSVTGNLCLEEHD